MREHVRCPGCDVRGKVRLLKGVVTIFWKRDDLTWWADKVSLTDLSDGFLCGFCGVPSSALRWNHLAQTKRSKR